MAKMYSRKRGQSGSTKPSEIKIPTWMNHKPKEVELLVVKLAKEGYSTSEIGLHLRDSYGIPDVKSVTKKPITKILEERKLTGEIPEDLMSVIEKSVKLSEHLEENKKDFTAKRGLQLAGSRIKRLVDYYKKSKKLPKDFKYDQQSIKLYVQK